MPAFRGSPAERWNRRLEGIGQQDRRPAMLWIVTADPQSLACFQGMSEVVAEEIQVRLDLQDRDVDDPDWARRIAALAVDALLDCYVVRPRSADPAAQGESPA